MVTIGTDKDWKVRFKGSWDSGAVVPDNAGGGPMKGTFEKNHGAIATIRPPSANWAINQPGGGWK